MNPKDAHMIAEYINTIEDPVTRREMHEYQHRLNGVLESLQPAERVEVICNMMKENIQTLDDKLKELKEML